VPLARGHLSLKKCHLLGTSSYWINFHLLRGCLLLKTVPLVKGHFTQKKLWFVKSHISLKKVPLAAGCLLLILWYTWSLKTYKCTSDCEIKENNSKEDKLMVSRGNNFLEFSNRNHNSCFNYNKILVRITFMFLYFFIVAVISYVQ